MHKEIPCVTIMEIAIEYTAPGIFFVEISIFCHADNLI
jgi:hypothetical protein